MNSHSPAKILAFVGLPGAGKSSAVDYVAAKGIPKVYGGGLIVQGVKDLGWDVTPENEKKYREMKRAQEGNDVFIKMAAEQIQHIIDGGQRKVLLDGLYTWSEYKFLKRMFPGELLNVAIVAPKHIRHRRLTKRPVRPLTHEEATERDWAEIENLEKGGPIAIADHYLINDSSLDKLHADIDSLTKELDF